MKRKKNHEKADTFNKTIKKNDEYTVTKQIFKSAHPPTRILFSYEQWNWQHNHRINHKSPGPRTAGYPSKKLQTPFGSHILTRSQ